MLPHLAIALRAGPRAAIPFALGAGAGVSALGAGFGAWALAAAAVLLVIAVGDLRRHRQVLQHVLMLGGAGVIVAVVCAWPTLVDLSGSLHVADNIASTRNPGNLHTPLHLVQVFGVWLGDSYKHVPTGADGKATYVLAAITFVACLLGAVRIVRGGHHALAGWLALTLAVWLGFALTSTTWVQGKVLMLTSPVVVLIAWAGLATLRASRLHVVAPILGLVLVGGVLVSDAMQYHASNLAPTARYRELSEVNSRFAGKGPALFTDFDEYALYELRDLDVGGPNFEYPPPALAPGRVAGERGYRYPVELDRLPPVSLVAYPLIVTRRDPAGSRPPSAYRLLWHGAYYEVWARRPRAPAARAVSALSGPLAEQCSRIGRLAGVATRTHASLIAADRPQLVDVPLAHASRSAGWRRLARGIFMSGPGRLSIGFALPDSGRWRLWLQGQIMPAVGVAIDGHRIASVGAQLDGHSVVLNTLSPLAATLAAAHHLLSLTRGDFSPAPGDGGAATLYAAFLTPAQVGPEVGLTAVQPGRWRSICSRSHERVEVVQ